MMKRQAHHPELAAHCFLARIERYRADREAPVRQRTYTFCNNTVIQPN
jgi:hypothetical protein